MSTIPSLVHTTAGALLAIPVFTLVRALFVVSIAASLLILFKPLLSGIARAAVLAVNPRLDKKELLMRSRMRDEMIMQRAIDTSHSPSHVAELRALAARE